MSATLIEIDQVVAVGETSQVLMLDLQEYAIQEKNYWLADDKEV